MRVHYHCDGATVLMTSAPHRHPRTPLILTTVRKSRGRSTGDITSRGAPQVVTVGSQHLFEESRIVPSCYVHPSRRENEWPDFYIISGCVRQPVTTSSEDNRLVVFRRISFLTISLFFSILSWIFCDCTCRSLSMETVLPKYHRGGGGTLPPPMKNIL